MDRNQNSRKNEKQQPPPPPPPQQQQQQQPQQQPAPPPPPQESAGNAQRFPNRMLKLVKTNAEVRNGMCYIIYRSEMDPRWPEPQVIDEAIVDRNRLHSMNLQYLNPDLTVRTQVKCICTRMLSLRDDWYAMTHEGTVLCNMCARCFRCFTLCFTAGRKLTSIDGFVLCNTCMLSYGRYPFKMPRIKVQPMPRSLGDLEEEMSGKASAENSGGGGGGRGASEGGAEAKTPNNNGSNNNNNNCSSRCVTTTNNSSNNEPLTEPRFRKEGRRPLRKIYYPDPRPPNHNRPDYKFEAPPYMAVDKLAGSQACPECNQQALAQALVVPGIARVYHEKSFRCANCKRPMYAGYQLPYAQFEACSCVQQPKVWCTSYQCRTARVAHHVEKNCHLEPLHPGGRPKRDVPGFLPRFDPADDKKILEQARREKLRQEKRQKKLPKAP